MQFHVKIEEEEGFLIRRVEAQSPVAALARTKLLFPETQRITLKSAQANTPTSK